MTKQFFPIEILEKSITTQESSLVSMTGFVGLQADFIEFRNTREDTTEGETDVTSLVGEGTRVYFNSVVDFIAVASVSQQAGSMNLDIRWFDAIGNLKLYTSDESGASGLTETTMVGTTSVGDYLAVFSVQGTTYTDSIRTSLSVAITKKVTKKIRDLV